MTAIVSRSDRDHIPVINWERVGNELDMRGYAVIRNVLTPRLCSSISVFYDEDALFLSRIDMIR